MIQKIVYHEPAWQDATKTFVSLSRCLLLFDQSPDTGNMIKDSSCAWELKWILNCEMHRVNICNTPKPSTSNSILSMTSIAASDFHQDPPPTTTLTKNVKVWFSLSLSLCWSWQGKTEIVKNVPPAGVECWRWYFKAKHPNKTLKNSLQWRWNISILLRSVALLVAMGAIWYNSELVLELLWPDKSMTRGEWIQLQVNVRRPGVISDCINTY